jgi:hypothetical protein
MKKYEVKDLESAIKSLDEIQIGNPVIEDFIKDLRVEFKKRNAPKFIKATDAYLKTLKRSDVYVRYMKEDDEFYYPGMQGLFKKGTNKLLRRHTDTGFLNIPND